MQVTIVEKAPSLRSGGYIIDFWGAGFDVAERMGLLPEIRRKGYGVQEVRVVKRNGERVAGFSVDVFARVTKGRYLSLPRGELARTIFGQIEGKVETVFGDSVARIEQSESGVQVAFESGAVRSFDLVVGADGLHSRVREIVYGPESRFEKYLGYKVAAFETKGYRPRDELVYVMYTEVGRQVARFALRNDQTLFLFTFADESADSPHSLDLQGQKAVLRKHFGGSGWECPRILDALDASDDLYFDRVSQIRMTSPDGLWTRGRVTLVGDSAFCVSLLAGQGSALAMVAAYILAGELHRANGDYAAAFARYEERFGPLVLHKQEAALGFAGTFAPQSKFALFLRNRVMNLLKLRWVADIVFSRGFRDTIVLPDYP